MSEDNIAASDTSMGTNPDLYYTSTDMKEDMAMIMSLIAKLPQMQSPDSVIFMLKAIDDLEFSNFAPLKENIDPTRRYYTVSTKTANAISKRMNLNLQRRLNDALTYQQLMRDLRRLAQKPAWRDLSAGHFSIQQLRLQPNETPEHVTHRIRSMVNKIMSADHLYFILLSYVIHEGGYDKEWKQTETRNALVLRDVSKRLRVLEGSELWKVSPEFHSACTSFVESFT